MIKFAIILSYVLIAILFVIVFFQQKAIDKLTPAAPGSPADKDKPNADTTSTNRTSQDQDMSFKDMVDSIKDSAKTLKIETTF